MAAKIILTIEEGLTTREVDDLRYLLSDALGDFAVKRNDAKAYVEGRYVGADYYPNQDEKIQQVLRRVRLARKLHGPALQFTIALEADHTNHVCKEVLCKDPYATECPSTIDRAVAALAYLQETFGMTEEEARAAYNQLEDKRVSKLMVEQGLVKS